MTPERYRQLCELFDQAHPLAPAERAAFVGRVAAGDPALADDLDRLLAQAQQAQAEQFLEGTCPVRVRTVLGIEPAVAPVAADGGWTRPRPLATPTRRRTPWLPRSPKPPTPWSGSGSHGDCRS
jgi:hypothetical protein